MQFLRRTSVASIQQNSDGVEANLGGLVFVHRDAMQQLRVGRTIFAAQRPDTCS